ncbi:MAG: hypothetical protein ACO1TE_13545 [Prosthecobacter sp.]
MTLPQITFDVPTLKLILSIVGGLLLISMVRILFLLRTNRRLRESTAKMEKQVLTQQGEILAVRQDSNAWRGETQRMFDAFRAEFSKRLEESEQRYKDIQQRAPSSPPAAAAAAPAPTAFSAPPAFVPPTPVAKLPPPPPAFVPQADPTLEEDDSVAPLPALTIS